MFKVVLTDHVDINTFAQTAEGIGERKLCGILVLQFRTSADTIQPPRVVGPDITLLTWFRYASLGVNVLRPHDGGNAIFFNILHL